MRFALGIAIAFILVSFNNCTQVNFENTRGIPCGDKAGISKCGKVDAVLSYVMMTKNMACVMCHTRFHGDLSGFGSMTFRADSEGTIIGNIFAPDLKLQQWTAPNGTFYLDPSFVDTYTNADLVAQVLPELISSNLIGSAPNYVIRPGEKHNIFGPVNFQGGGLYTLTHSDPEIRSKAAADIVINPLSGRPLIHENEFPFLSVSKCMNVAGTITTADGEVLRSPIQGNLVLINGKHLTGLRPDTAPDSFNDYDLSCPGGKTLTVNGEVVVTGDLVLAGCVKGKGTIYAAGSIFIPDDIKNVNSAFPFSETVDKDILRGEATARAGKDMLSLATEKFIVAGKIRFEVIAHEEQDPIFRENRAELENVYNWLSGGSASQGAALYDSAFLKRKLFGESGRGVGAVSLIEANLFANKGIAATMTSIYNTNLVINGSVLTPNISMLVSGWTHNSGVNPFNGRPFANSEINQDFRLKYSVDGYECHRNR